MFCINCGSELPDGSKFCTNCGAKQETETAKEPEIIEEQEPETIEEKEAVETPKAEPEAVKPEIPAAGVIERVKEKLSDPAALIKNPKVLGIAGGVVLVIIVAALLIGGVFTGPKGKVLEALSNTAEALAEPAEILGTNVLSDLAQSQKVKQTVGVTVEELSENTFGREASSVVEDIAIELVSEVNIPKKQVGAYVTAFYEEESLISAQIILDDAELFASVPELTDGRIYGLNTETLCADLSGLGLEMEEFEEVSFNIFELMEQLAEASKPDKKVEKAVKTAIKDFSDAIEVEKTGKETISVNRSSVKCTAYHVIVPQDAMENLYSAIMDAASETDYTEIYAEIFESIGMPDDTIDEFVDAMDEADPDEVYDQMDDMVDMIFDALGDVEFDVYIDGKYVMAIIYENEIEGVEIELGMYFGGGKVYADDISLELSAGNAYSKVRVSVTSTGDHTAKKGVYTDETTIKVKSDDFRMLDMTVETSFDAKAKENNFSWKLDLGMMYDDYSKEFEGTLEAEATGTLKVGGNSYHMAINELALVVDGEDIITLGVDYKVESCRKLSVKVKDPVMLATLDEDDIMDIAEDIQDNAMDWAKDLQDKVM